MKVILLQDVKKVGQKGMVAEVADGYAQNVLIPKRLAAVATPANIKKAESEQEKKAQSKAMQAIMSRGTLDMINGKTITIKTKASEAGTLFEAIHEKQILEAIKKEFNIALPESALTLDGPIKKVGEYHLPLSLGGATAVVTLQLVSSASFPQGDDAQKRSPVH